MEPMELALFGVWSNTGENVGGQHDRHHGHLHARLLQNGGDSHPACKNLTHTKQYCFEPLKPLFSYLNIENSRSGSLVELVDF